MTLLSHVAAGLSMPITFVLPSKRKLSPSRVHSDSRSCPYCQLWHPKPNTSKTMTSGFHLHNNSSRPELNVHMNGQRLKHDQYPVYLNVTLDRTLSYREHLSCSAAKLKSRKTWSWNSLALHEVPALAPFAHEPWLYAMLSRRTLLSSVG